MDVRDVTLTITIHQTGNSRWDESLRSILAASDISFTTRDLDSIREVEEPTVEEVFGAPLYSVRVNGDEAEADSYSGAALALHTLAKENGD